MRFPERNSRGEAILKAFLKGPMTIYQGAEAHGDFATPKNPDGVDHEKMVQLYCDLVDRGCLVREGILYRLTLHAKFHLEKQALPATPPQIVPAKIASYFEKRIFAGYAPRNPWRLVL